MDRITPAGAGKTNRGACGGVRVWDHPRRCGENIRQHNISCLCIGSPPQVRGKLISSIPLYVNIEDHPRRCGENYGYLQHPILNPGSPPQVRGKPVTKQLWHRRVGITPAGAGKTRIPQ